MVISAARQTFRCSPPPSGLFFTVGLLLSLVASQATAADHLGQSPTGTITGRPLWLGSATFDQRVEISRTTGGFTHQINPEIDNERDKLLLDTVAADAINGYYWVARFQSQAEGKNGGGDPYQTDQRLAVGVIDLLR